MTEPTTSAQPAGREAARISELRLTRFKNYQNQTVPLHPLTLIVGPNGSGKSNVLDALSLLALLADERDVADLERDDRNVTGLRGNLSGAAPFGTTTVAVGCSILSTLGEYRLDVEFDVLQPVPEIVSETLTFVPTRGRERTTLQAHRRSPGEGICDVSVYSGAARRSMTMLTSRLVTLQALTKVAQDSAGRRLVVEDCRLVVETLKSILVVDPVPGSMRSYARIGQPPDRLGSSTSAVAYALREDAQAWERLTSLMKGLIGAGLESIDFVEAKLASAAGSAAVDVMVALRERYSAHSTTPASLMSDGSLRYLAIVTTLLSLSRDVNIPTSSRTSSTKTFLVEEVENGLFPRQASAVLNLLKSETRERGVNMIATTHSPALLDALEPTDHQGVLICIRSAESGLSTLQPLRNHPNYLRLVADGRLGSAIAVGELDFFPRHEVVVNAADELIDMLMAEMLSPEHKADGSAPPASTPEVEATGDSRAHGRADERSL